MQKDFGLLRGLTEELVFVKAQEKARKENLSPKKFLEAKSLREVYLKYGVL
jgi:hypothetical protein